MAGSTFSVTFTDDGTYNYICMVHPWMTGVVFVDPAPTPTQITGSINVEGFLVSYQITGGNVHSITPDLDVKSLIVGISATNSGKLTITLPRGLIDSKIGTADDGFIVLANGKEVTFNESKTSRERTLTISFPAGTEEIEIIGTNLFVTIPEPITPTPTPTPIRDITPPKILKPSDVIVDATDSNGERVFYDVLAIDDTDKIIKPSCRPSSGSIFPIGDTMVTCTASDSAGNSARPVSFIVTVNAPGIIIPDWIKEVAAFWCDDKIDDTSFIEGIQYLIDNDIILVPTTSSGAGGSQTIPSWVKNNACWWSLNLISDEDFAGGLQYLIGQGIIRV